MNEATATPETAAPAEETGPENNSNGSSPQTDTNVGLFDSKPAEDTTPSPDPETTPAPESAPPGTIAERPAHIAEQFWDAEKGVLKDEALSNSYNDLRKEFNKLQQEKGGEAPENDGDYLVDYKPPHRSRPTGDEKEGKVLDKFANLKKDDPLFKAFAKGAKGVKLSQSQFNDFMQITMEELHPLLPEKFNRKKEMELLGTGGEEMVKINNKWGNALYKDGVLNEAEHKRMETLASNAVGIQLLNKLRINSGEKPIPGKLNGNANTGRKTPDECQAMMADERYYVEGGVGDAYRAEVDKAFAETFGTNPA